ncbi:MAG TPA: Wzz/FepE/Etk N-terminal domain-containing protein [Bryobacteraceae bacterium]|nr:Wzz/FepE/Etk N-terminal domain-containing protein [Bryobacteraceae bacterium]
MEYSPLQTSLRDLVFVLFKRKWSIITIILVTALCSTVWLWVIRENMYTASTKLLVKLGQEQAPPPTVVNGLPMVTGYRFQEVNSEVEIFQSYDLIAKVVDQFKLYEPGPPPPKPPGGFPLLKYRVKKTVADIEDWADNLMIKYGLREKMSKRDAIILTLQKALNVAPEKDTNIFVAQLTMPYRLETPIILNRLVDDYLDYRLRIYRTRGAEFFRSRTNETRADLDKVSTQLQQYEAAGDISVLEKQQEQLVQQIANAETALHNSDLALADAQSKVTRLDAELRKDDPNFGRLGEFDKDSFPAGVLTQLADLQREREKLRMTELDNGDRIRNNRSQFHVLTDMLSANLRAVLADCENDERARASTLGALKTQLTDLHNRQMDWEALNRKKKDDEEIYDYYRRKLEETATMVALENDRIGNVTVIQRATDPVIPSGLRKTRLFAVCLLVSIFLALAWVSVAEFFDHKIYTPEGLEKHLGAPVIGVSQRHWRPLAALRRNRTVQSITGAHV